MKQYYLWVIKLPHRLSKIAALMLLTILPCQHLSAHGQATYLGNSAVVVSNAKSKIIFDPFFHNDFGVYRLVPENIHQQVMQGIPPYDAVDAVFISHAHEDHFDVEDVVTYMTKHHAILLFAPKQAIDQILTVTNDSDIIARLRSVQLSFDSLPYQHLENGLSIDAVRIPHAGWPKRQDVENVVFRVTLSDKLTTMHMGDADPDDNHYLPYQDHWLKTQTDLNFPPYWFLMSAEGNDILKDILNVKHSIGVHVPIEVPSYLQRSGKPYFYEPGSQIDVE